MPRCGTKKGGALNLVTRPRKGAMDRRSRVSRGRSRPGGFHGCGGSLPRVRTRVVHAASIHRGVVPPNRRLPPTNDFFGASTGLRSGQTVARCSPASSYLGFAMIGVRVGVMRVPCDFSTSTCEPLARTWPPTDDRVAGIFFFVIWSPKRNPSLFPLFARRLTRATFVSCSPLTRHVPRVRPPKGYTRRTYAEFGEVAPLHPLRLPRPTKVIVARPRKRVIKTDSHGKRPVAISAN